MHGLEAKRGLIQAPLAEVLTETSFIVPDNFLDFSTVHVLKKNEETAIPLIYVYAFEQLFAI